MVLCGRENSYMQWLGLFLLINVITYSYACTELTASNTEDTFTSHIFYGIADYLNGMDDCWVIHAPADDSVVQIYSNRFHVEYHHDCDYDSLKVYCEDDDDDLVDRYCGSSGPDDVYSTAGGSLYLKFHTDNSQVADGFEITYVAVDSSSVSASALCDRNLFDHDNDNHSVHARGITVGGIVGVVIFVIFVIAIVVVVVVCCVVASKSRARRLYPQGHCNVRTTATVFQGRRNANGRMPPPPPYAGNQQNARPYINIGLNGGTPGYNNTAPGKNGPPGYNMAPGGYNMTPGYNMAAPGYNAAPGTGPMQPGYNSMTPLQPMPGYNNPAYNAGPARSPRGQVNVGIAPPMGPPPAYNSAYPPSNPSGPPPANWHSTQPSNGYSTVPSNGSQPSYSTQSTAPSCPDAPPPPAIYSDPRC